MNQKIGRNDPCPCGSGKKYKSCCFLQKPGGKQKLKAKWLNAPQAPNLMERAFGNAIAETGKTFVPLQEGPSVSENKQEEGSKSES